MAKDYTDLHRYFMKHDMDWIMKFNTKLIHEKTKSTSPGSLSKAQKKQR